MTEDRLIRIINSILAKKGMTAIDPGYSGSIIRDLDFDSFDLAEFYVRVEKEFGIDPFGEGYTDNIEEINKRVTNNKK